MMKRNAVAVALLVAGCSESTDLDTALEASVSEQDPMVDWYLQRTADEQRALEGLFFELGETASSASTSAEHRTALIALEDGLAEIVGLDAALTFPLFTSHQLRRMTTRMKPPRDTGRLIDQGWALDETPVDGAPPPYVAFGTTRSDTSVTWCLKSATSDLTTSAQEDAIAAAMEEWALYTPVTFTQSSSCSGADIKIRFDTGKHGDGSNNAFDDDGHMECGWSFSGGTLSWECSEINTLAHAFYPGSSYDKRICFDDYETWITSGTDGYDVTNVALHEVGHWLGLSHSDDSSAVMDGSYSEGLLTLQSDDIDGIQSLYGTDNCDNSWDDAQLVYSYTGLAALYSGIAESVDSSASPVDDLWDDAYTLGQETRDDGYDAAVGGKYSAGVSNLQASALSTMSAVSNAQDEAAATSVNSSARYWLNLADNMGDLAYTAALDTYIHGYLCMLY